MNKKYNFISFFFVSVIFFVFIFTILREITREVLIEKYNMDNYFVRLVMFDHQELIGEGNESKDSIDTADSYEAINSESENVLYDDSKRKTGLYDVAITNITKYKNKINGVKEKITEHTTERLPGYHYLASMGNYYCSAMQWDYTVLSEYNPVVELEEGYYASLTSPAVVTEGLNVKKADELEELSSYCKDNNIDFTYVIYPRQVSRDDDVSGILDYSNYDNDNLIEELEKRNVDYLDIRPKFEAFGRDKYHDLFFNTDHHWTPEAGMIVAKIMLDYINSKGGKTDSSLLSEDLFEKKIYHNYYMGSTGEKLIGSGIVPDDFSIYYPIYDTSIHYSRPSANIDTIGDFTVMYDYTQLNKNMYGYSDDAYGLYDYGECDLIHIDNMNINNGYKILIIHDSFCDVVIPFMAIGVDKIDEIDLRYYKDGLYDYIEKSKPNVVIVAYGSISGNSFFDFN